MVTSVYALTHPWILLVLPMAIFVADYYLRKQFNLLVRLVLLTYLVVAIVLLAKPYRIDVNSAAHASSHIDYTSITVWAVIFAVVAFFSYLFSRAALGQPNK